MVEQVVLVHGLWMKGLELIPLQNRLRAQGFTVHRFAYPSRHATVAQNARRLNDYLCTLDAKVLHLVGHSLGGLVLLRCLTLYKDLPHGRVVLLASPVCGSSVARQLATNAWGRWYLGRSIEGGLLGDGPAWYVRRPVGVIAGTLGFGPGHILGPLKGPDDGTVAVRETCFEGAEDATTVHATHMGLVLVRKSADLVGDFLRRGRFS